MTRKRIILLAVAAAVFLVVAFVGWQGARAWWAWRGIERIEFDTAAGTEPALPPLQPKWRLVEPMQRCDTGAHLRVVEYDTVLAIGPRPTESRAADPVIDQEGVYADAVLFWLAPTNGGDPVLVSLPRDLLVIDPCTGEETKLDRTLAGCGEDVSGPELVALAVEDYTGIAVDHFATFGFEGFVEVIDSLGGVEICVEYALREGATDICFRPGVRWLMERRHWLGTVPRHAGAGRWRVALR